MSGKHDCLISMFYNFPKLTKPKLNMSPKLCKITQILHGLYDLVSHKIGLAGCSSLPKGLENQLYVSPIAAT